MKYICNSCNKCFDDDDNKCICGSEDISELIVCRSCEGEYRAEDLTWDGICYNCERNIKGGNYGTNN